MLPRPGGQSFECPRADPARKFLVATELLWGQHFRKRGKGGCLTLAAAGAICPVMPANSLLYALVARNDR